MGAQQSNSSNFEGKADKRSPKRDIKLEAHLRIPSVTNSVNKAAMSSRGSQNELPEAGVDNGNVKLCNSTGSSPRMQSTKRHIGTLQCSSGVATDACVRKSEFHAEVGSGSLPLAITKPSDIPTGDSVESTNALVAPSDSLSSKSRSANEKSDFHTVQENSYRQTLNRYDEFYSNNNDQRVFWLLGRFLSNEEIAAKVIKKFWSMGLRAEWPQKMISYFLRFSFENLSADTMKFLLSTEHSKSNDHWVPYGIQSIKSFMVNSREFAEAVRKIDRVKVEVVQRRKQSECSPTGDNEGKGKASKPPRKTIKIPEKPLAVVDFQNVLKSYESGKLRKGVQLMESRILSAEADDSTSVRWSFADLELVIGAGKIPEGKILKSDDVSRNGELKLDAEPLYQETDMLRSQPLANISTCYEKKVLGSSTDNIHLRWPWNANCDVMLRHVRCLVQINSTLKSGNTKSVDHEEEKKKPRGRRVRRGKNKSQDANSSDEEVETESLSKRDHDTCRHLGCFTLQEELAKNSVSGVCKIWTVFPYYERKTNTVHFLQASNKDQDRPIQLIFPNITRCDCSMSNKVHKENSSNFSVLTFSSGQRHFHDNLVLDLILPSFKGAQSWQTIPKDAIRLIDILSRYVCQVRKECMEVGLRIADKAVSDHFQDVQSMCQSIFCFVIFCEVCGPAQQGMAGGFYLTAAREHYEKAFNSAVSAAILPSFVNLLNNHIVGFPSSMKLVENPAIYATAFNFLDLRLPDITTSSMNNMMRSAYKDIHVEAAATTVLGTILGAGYQHAIDDAAAFKAITGQVRPHHHTNDIAVVSPVFDLRPQEDGYLNLYRFSEHTFYHSRRETRIKTEKEIAALEKDLSTAFAMEFESERERSKEEGERVDEKEMESDPRMLSAQIHAFFDGLRQKIQPKRNVEENIPGPAQEVSEDGNKHQKISSDRMETHLNSNENSAEGEKALEKVSENDRFASAEGNTPGGSGKDNGSNKPETAMMASVNEGLDPSKAKKKKPNRDFLSPAKRQQRQAQRLREKWEKKHKSGKK